MSNFQKGEWQKLWDSLFWRFMNEHSDFFLKNPSMGMLIRSFDNMFFSKKDDLIKTAENYLKIISQ